MSYMHIQEFVVWYKNFISTDLYLIINIIVIALSFASGRTSARIMCSSLSKKRYGETLEKLNDDVNKINESWKEAYTYFSKANTYLCLAIFLIIQFIMTIFINERDGISTTVLMFTIAVSIMEYRDNKSEYKKRGKTLIEEQLKIIMQAEELKNLEFQDKILTELEKKGFIDKEKRKEIINDLKIE